MAAQDSMLRAAVAWCSAFVRGRGPVVVGLRGLGISGSRSAPRIRPGLHDVMIVYPRPGTSTMVVAASTMPWQAAQTSGFVRPAVILPQGEYVASPTLIDRTGLVTPYGRPAFILTDPRSGAAVDLGTGPLALYSTGTMRPHVGCQTVGDLDWSAFRQAVEHGPFRYVLVDLGSPGRDRPPWIRMAA